MIEAEHVLAVREQLRRFVDQHMPRDAVGAWDRTNHFPRDVFAALAELGVMGTTIPEEYGGTGRDIVLTMAIIEELARRSMAVAVPYLMCTCYGGMNIVECGSDAQKKHLLPRLAKGEILFAYGLTEPDVGADLASVRTRAERKGDVVVVNGAKRFCSGADISDYIYTLVRTGKPDERHRNLTLLLIPPSAAGVTITRIEPMGMRGVATTDVTFADVEIPADNIVGGEAGWNTAWPMLSGPGLEVERLEAAALALGLAEAAADDAWKYSQERVQFGRPICRNQSIRHLLADARTQLFAARLVLYEAARLADANLPCGVQSAMAKLFVCETAKKVALDCQTIFGAYGLIEGFDIERYVRDALVLPIVGGSSAIQRNNIVKQLGLPA